MMFFWVLALCRLVKRCLQTSLHGAKTQKNKIIKENAALRTSIHIFYVHTVNYVGDIDMNEGREEIAGVWKSVGPKREDVTGNWRNSFVICNLHEVL
jgi:hypothetical protein